MESETAHIWKKIELFYIQCFFFLFVCRWWCKNELLRATLYKVFRYKCFCKKTLSERYLLKRVKSLVRHFQFMIGQKHNLLGHLILPRIFPVGQNVRCVFRLVGQFLILVGRCPMFDRYFKACLCYGIYRK